MVAEEDPRFRHLRKKIASFVAVAVAIVAAVVWVIGSENDLFSKKYQLTFTVEKGTGFTRGMPVKLSGFRIGRIKSVSLNESAAVDVVLQIDKKYQKWIRKDSTVKLVKEGLVGDAVIEVSVGSPRVAQLQDKEQIAYVKTKALDEMADEIAEKVKPVLIEVRDIIGYVNDPKGDIKQSMRNLNVLSRNLESTRQRADMVLVKAGDDVGTISGKLSTAVDNTSAKLTGVLDDTSLTVKKANSSLGRLDEKLPALLANTETSLKNVESLTRDLKQTGETVLPKVPALVKKSEETLHGTNEVLHAVKGTWPISSHIKLPQEKQFVPGDSHD